MISPTFLCHDNYQQAFADIRTLLTDFGAVWRTRPFIDDEILWQKAHPELYEAVLSLDDDTVDSFDDEQVLMTWLVSQLPEAKALTRWGIAPFKGEVQGMEKFLDVGIGGRKVEQITGFSAVFKQAVGMNHDKVLDWCSGKGHLAKQLHYVTGAKVTCLEYNEQLCQCGSETVKRHNYPIEFIVQDVLKPIPSHALLDVKAHTALHACGDLHTSMMDCAVENQAQHIVFSPCCYHLTADAEYNQRTLDADGDPLRLQPKDLRLAVSQTVTAGQRVRRLRQQELVWRIAFDLLHREISGIDQYRPTPSIMKKWLSGSFENFCRLMAGKIGIRLPETIDADNLLAAAQLKYASVRRLEKVRLAFRQAMEYYLVLDKVLYLEAQGYDVELTLFCEQKVTPRNIVIIATRRGLKHINI